VGDAALSGQLAFQRRHLRAEDEAAGVEHARGGRLEVRADRRVLTLEIDLGDQKPSPRAEVATCPTPRRLMENRISLS
jgi:hypothetical protein